MTSRDAFLAFDCCPKRAIGVPTVARLMLRLHACMGLHVIHHMLQGCSRTSLCLVVLDFSGALWTLKAVGVPAWVQNQALP